VAANTYFPEKIYILQAAKPYQKKKEDGDTDMDRKEPSK
jgi:hypothetical protein